MSLLSFESLKTARITPAKTALIVAKDIARRVWNVAVAWNQRRKLVDLAQLDDRMLADLGLARGDVAAAVSEPLWRNPTTRLSVLAVERRASEREYARWRSQKATELHVTGQRKGRSFEICAD